MLLLPKHTSFKTGNTFGQIYGCQKHISPPPQALPWYKLEEGRVADLIIALCGWFCGKPIIVWKLPNGCVAIPSKKYASKE